MTILRFKVPGPDDPGYLRRMREGLRFRDQLAGGEPTPEMIEEMAKFLATYVTEPADYAARVEAMLDASESEFNQLLEALMGENAANPTKSTPKRKTASGTSSKGSPPKRRSGS